MQLAMISKLTEHIFLSVQPQFVPVLENALQVHSFTNACQEEKKKKRTFIAVV